ncbi:hypothetical protein PV328_000981 [Microctonus aethiopoides]|uniref:Uncharacterized protein n=1 Tax=Microctonus aethiopoides TaxID=144406 RepID=A0AA39FW88_9HYME|nr:hypothetical protein PV328_000981 [Microctonus aethiopoides]
MATASVFVYPTVRPLSDTLWVTLNVGGERQLSEKIKSVSLPIDIQIIEKRTESKIIMYNEFSYKNYREEHGNLEKLINFQTRALSFLSSGSWIAISCMHALRVCYYRYYNFQNYSSDDIKSVYLVFRHHVTSVPSSLLVVYPVSVVFIVALKNLLNSIEKVSLLVVSLITQKIFKDPRIQGSKEGSKDPRKDPRIQERIQGSKKGSKDPRKDPRIQERIQGSKKGSKDPRKDPRIQERIQGSKKGSKDPRKDPRIQERIQGSKKGSKGPRKDPRKDPRIQKRIQGSKKGSKDPKKDPRIQGRIQERIQGSEKGPDPSYPPDPSSDPTPDPFYPPDPSPDHPDLHSIHPILPSILPPTPQILG